MKKRKNKKEKKQTFGKISEIKSIYILKRIFSSISKIKKLDIIFYNKKIQSKLDINIEDYKPLTNIEKRGEKNGKGKEYLINTDILIYEGEYKNWKRNGKGIEYYENGKKKI